MKLMLYKIDIQFWTQKLKIRLGAAVYFCVKEAIKIHFSSICLMFFQKFNFTTLGFCQARKFFNLIYGSSFFIKLFRISCRMYDVDPVSHRMFKREQRISFTFRKRRNQPCKVRSSLDYTIFNSIIQCKFMEFCDWDRNGKMAIPNDDKNGRLLEKEYVKNVSFLYIFQIYHFYRCMKILRIILMKLDILNGKLSISF